MGHKQKYGTQKLKQGLSGTWGPKVGIKDVQKRF